MEKVLELEQALWTPLLLNFLTGAASDVGISTGGDSLLLTRLMYMQYTGYIDWAPAAVVLPSSVYLGDHTGRFIQWKRPASSNTSWEKSIRLPHNSSAEQHSWAPWTVHTANAGCTSGAGCSSPLNATVAANCSAHQHGGCHHQNITVSYAVNSTGHPVRVRCAGRCVPTVHFVQPFGPGSSYAARVSRHETEGPF